MFNFNELPFAYDKPQIIGSIKTSPEDFRVDEVLGFELTGEGEHLYLHIEKRGLNTEELVKSLARTLGKPEKNISYAGLKDRQAITTQWISVHCPGEEIPEPNLLQGQGWHVIENMRHLKKLKTGALMANDFTLILRDLVESSEIEDRLKKIKSGGVPNYFGPQRFGHAGQNLVKAENVLIGGAKIKNRFLRGIYYSAARAFLFNMILAQRVNDKSWDKALAGDVMQLAGTKSIFSIAVSDEIIQKRIIDGDVSPASPLWGRGEERVTNEAFVVQESVLANYKIWCDALVHHGLERAYRSLILGVENLTWTWQESALHLHFRLVPGSYATTVVRELISTHDER